MQTTADMDTTFRAYSEQIKCSWKSWTATDDRIVWLL